MRISPWKLYGIAAATLFAVCPSFGQINARIPTTSAALQALYGTTNIKVVFSYQNAFYFIDFSEATPQFRQISGVTSAYLPVISSDGKWITFQTGTDAESPYTGALVGKIWMRELAETGTPVKVADTGYVPRFVQNTSVDTPEIVYATSVACPQGICYNAGQTLKRKMIAAVAQPTQVVNASGSYYGGLSWDNRYLNTGWEGGPNGFMLDLQKAAGAPAATHTMHVQTIGTQRTRPWPWALAIFRAPPAAFSPM